MLNELILMGRLVANPVERKSNEENKSYATFTLAFDGIGKDEASFIDCVAFNNVANNLIKYCEKGDKVCVIGAIRQRKYVAKDGTQRSIYEVLVNSVEFLQPKKNEDPVNETSPEEKEELPPAPAGWEYGEDGKLHKIKQDKANK